MVHQARRALGDGHANRALGHRQPRLTGGSGNLPKSIFGRPRRGPMLHQRVRRFAPHLLVQRWASPRPPGGLFWPISGSSGKPRLPMPQASVSVAVASLQAPRGWSAASWPKVVAERPDPGASRSSSRFLGTSPTQRSSLADLTFRFLMHGFWADRRSPIFRVQVVPTGPKPLPTGGPLRGPPVGLDFCPGGAACALTLTISGRSQNHVLKT